MSQFIGIHVTASIYLYSFSVVMTSAGYVWTSGHYTTTKQADTLCELIDT